MKQFLITFILLLIATNQALAQNVGFNLKSIPKDEITKCYFEAGGGLGVDYIILWLNLGANINVYPIQFKYFKVSINNEVGVLLPWARILYYYPSAQIHFPIKDVWFLAGLGREYTQVENQDDEKFNRIINQRFDIGLKIYTSDHSTLTFTVPLRFDEEIPTYFTGIIVRINYRL